MSLAPAINSFAHRVNATLFHVASLYETLPFSSAIIKYVRNSYQNDPYRTILEFILLFFTFRYLLATPKTRESQIVLTEKEVDDLIVDWTPESLVPSPSPHQRSLISQSLVFKGPQGSHTQLASGQSVLNLATTNFIGLLSNQHIKDEAIKALRYYGVGTCGPCGFYGTFDVHQQLEKRLASFIGTQDAIVYAQAFSAAASIIPAFSKKGDIIVCDESIRFALQRGVQISKSTIKYYKHNDMKDLERVLKDIHTKDVESKRKVTRRFILAEGLSEYYGDVCPLAAIIELKKKYKFRLILDDSLAFGVLGSCGAGTAQHFNVPASDVDIIIGSLATTLCSSGGFCAGSLEIVDHQRLGSNAYVFSASLPAMLAVCALRGMDVLQQAPENGVLVRLMDTIKTFQGVFQQKEWTSSHAATLVELVGDVHSPIQYIRAKPNACKNRQTCLEWMQRVAQKVIDQGIVVTSTHYVYEFERDAPPPSIKVMLSNEFSQDQVIQVATTLCKSLNTVLA